VRFGREPRLHKASKRGAGMADSARRDSGSQQPMHLVGKPQRDAAVADEDDASRIPQAGSERLHALHGHGH
jgi:hypothetical protein